MPGLSNATSLSLTSLSGCLPSFILTARALSRASGGLYAGRFLNMTPKRGSEVRPARMAMSPPRGSPTPWAPLSARPFWSLVSAADVGAATVVGAGVGTGAGTAACATPPIPASTGSAASPAAPARMRRRDTGSPAPAPLNGHPPMSHSPVRPRRTARETGGKLGATWESCADTPWGCLHPESGGCGRTWPPGVHIGRGRSGSELAGQGHLQHRRGGHPLPHGAGGRDVVGVVLEQPLALLRVAGRAVHPDRVAGPAHGVLPAGLGVAPAEPGGRGDPLEPLAVSAQEPLAHHGEEVHPAGIGDERLDLRLRGDPGHAGEPADRGEQPAVLRLLVVAVGGEAPD